MVHISTEYTGYKVVTLNDEELAQFYSNKNENKFGNLINEYLIIKDLNGYEIDFYKWNGKEYIQVIQKSISNDFSGKVKPRNNLQLLAMDMLISDNTTVKILSGGWGVGKNYLMTAIAVDLVRKGKFEKIVWVRNNITLMHTNEIGFIPGTQDEKLLQWAMPLADCVGGEYGLEMLMKNRMIELASLGHMRGRSFKNSIIFVDEIENNTKEHMQLLISRVGEGSIIFMSGDWNQTDKSIFKTNSGLITAIEKLKGNPLFGYVHLVKTERSATAELASLLD